MLPFMRVLLHHAGYELIAVPVLLSDRERVHFYDRSRLVHLLALGVDDPHLLERLRELLIEVEPGAAWRLTGRDVLGRIAENILGGRIWVYEIPDVIPTGLPLGEEVDEPEPIEIVTTEEHWVSFQLVDNGTDEPYADVPLLITLPDDSEAEHTTNSEGIVELTPSKDGTCQLRSELEDRDMLKTLAFDSVGSSGSPTLIMARWEGWRRDKVRALTPEGKRNPATEDLRLYGVVRHHVQDGETMDSIAEQYGMTGDELRLYNFETTDSAEIQRMLRREIGCTVVDPETKNFVFSATDSPGIIHVPKELKLAALGTNLHHIIRVCRIDPDPPPFVLSA